MSLQSFSCKHPSGLHRVGPSQREWGERPKGVEHADHCRQAPHGVRVRAVSPFGLTLMAGLGTGAPTPDRATVEGMGRSW